MRGYETWMSLMITGQFMFTRGRGPSQSST